MTSYRGDFNTKMANYKVVEANPATSSGGQAVNH